MPIEEPIVTGDAAKVLRFINTILLSLVGVMGTFILYGVEKGREEGRIRFEVLESKFIALDKEQAIVRSNQYTASDHIKFAEAITFQINSNDKRITKLEDGMVNLRDGQASMLRTLDAIRDGLGLPKK